MTEEDLADIVLRRWAAEEKIAGLAQELAQSSNLDPALVEAVEDACREDDVYRIIEAITEVLRAVKAQGLL